MDYQRRLIAAPSRTDPDALAVGQSTMPRGSIVSNTLPSVSGRLFLSFFTADVDRTIGNLRLISGTTAAGATPTLVRAGIYRDSDLALIGSIPNDTSIFAAASTAYTRALSTPVNLLAGQRYAVGILIVTAAALPTLIGSAYSGYAGESTVLPRISASMSSQTDLPATAALTANTLRVYSVVLP